MSTSNTASPLSPEQAYARWIELVCGRDADLVGQARDALGEDETMPDLDTLMETLAEMGVGTHADMKDDETLEWHADTMCMRRGITGFAAPPAPPEGPARCSAILNTLNALAPQHDARLVVIGEGDPWCAVIVAAADVPEFLSLCGQLDIEVLGEEEWQ